MKKIKTNQEMANAIRFLSMDAVQKANSGHPGMPMGMADVATVLFGEFLKFDAKNPKWLNRDRFVLSAGHGSMLLYSLLYLTGYEDISIEDIKNFRQLHSKCAGHPEFGHLNGVETTTGPLGQGLATAVGIALGERLLAARIGEEIIDHKTYVIAGDGCLMEGISQEAISIAGHLKLNKLVVLWDNNSISIDGDISLSSSENMKMRFEACGWKVLKVDGHNFDEIRNALNEAQNCDKPILIDCKTIIAFGSPNKSGSEKSHGAPLGNDEIDLVRKELNWPHEPFFVPDEILSKWREIGEKSAENFENWQKSFNNLEKSKILEVNRILNQELPQNFQEKLENFKKDLFSSKPKYATRKSSQIALEFLTKELEELIGGSADLTGSVLTKTSSTLPISKNDFSGRYIYYGIREHIMAAMMNGISLHSNFIPYAGTFLVFCDYMKPAIRLAALMKRQVIYILTHDSIGLGEDGPTHQPIEHLASLRAIPNLNVFRPCDAAEVIDCFEQALKSKETPSAMMLSRQELPFLSPEASLTKNNCAFGGYIIEQTNDKPDVVLIATGSEVEIAINAKKSLQENNLSVRVVSMPCFEIFDKQSKEYKEDILGDDKVLKIGIEAAIDQGWYKIIGKNSIFIGMKDFGASAKAKDLYEHFKITSENICDLVLKKING